MTCMYVSMVVNEGDSLKKQVIKTHYVWYAWELFGAGNQSKKCNRKHTLGKKTFLSDQKSRFV